MDVEKLKAIVSALEGTEISRLDYRNGEERLVIQRGHPPVYASGAPSLPQSLAAPVAQLTTPPGPANDAQPAAAIEAPGVVVSSPFVGTFYRSPSPDAASFVEIGQSVRKGQVLCIVEAMKLMNEIESEVGGRILEILVQNGEPVEFGQPLFRIEPS